MTPFQHPSVYSLELQWTFAWFPVRESSELKEVRMRGGASLHRSITPLGYFLVDSPGLVPGQDALDAFGRIRAFALIGVGSNGLYQADLHMNIGSSVLDRRLILPPNTTTPFMMNVRYRGEIEEFKGTAAVLQGVFSAGSRPSAFEVIAKGLGF